MKQNTALRIARGELADGQNDPESQSTEIKVGSEASARITSVRGRLTVKWVRSTADIETKFSGGVRKLLEELEPVD
jgi:hypothetical protein